jgi:hypothetical protein
VAERGNDEFRRRRCRAQPDPSTVLAGLHLQLPHPPISRPDIRDLRMGGLAHGDPDTRIKHPFRRVCGQHCLRRSAAELAVPTQAAPAALVMLSCHTETLAHAPARTWPALTTSS